MSTPPLSNLPNAAATSLQPFVLEPVLVERIWGTDDLGAWTSRPAEGKAIGEIWLTAENCKVEDGSAGGATLAELTSQAPEALGDPHHNGFPLLIKLLFPREKLSVQVHPNDAEAQALGMPRGKTECWYVLSAEPGAQVAVGFVEPLSREQIKASIQDGSLEEKLQMLPVAAGDMVFVDAGTIHAIGPGMVVLETQQYSDTTYRLWDYGRPRELHVDAGTAVTRSQTAAGKVAATPGDGYTRLVSCEYFVVDRFDFHAEPMNASVNATPNTVKTDAAKLGSADRLQILIALSDGCSLQPDGGEGLSLPRGKAVVLPVMNGSYTLQGAAGSQVIRVQQP